MAIFLPMVCAAGGPVELKAGRFTLRFSADGRPGALAEAGSGKEFLRRSKPGAGFILAHSPTHDILLSRLSLEPDGRLTAASENGTQRVVFRVHARERYIAFRIERLIGIPTTGLYALRFELNASDAVAAMPLDYMTVDRCRPGQVGFHWPFIWNRHKSNPLGGFALYTRTDDADEDETILRIWVQEKLPHPKVEGEWDLEAARRWVVNWLEAFTHRGRMTVEAETAADLVEAASYARKAGIGSLYVMPWIWRGEYWPKKTANAGINRAIFPKGLADLKACADKLRAQDVSLRFHYVAGGIGPWDPKYVGAKPDRRLAAWGTGALAEAAKADATTLKFRPSPGVEMAYQSPRRLSTVIEALRPPGLQHVFRFDAVRVGDEIVRVGAFEDTDRAVWTLQGCRRGFYDTHAAAHPAGAEAAGLILAYGQNFVPDNDSTLLEEVARAYAGVLNATGSPEMHYDGAEIHMYNGRKWGFEKFASLVYRHVDHPCLSNTSHGRAAACSIEYRLNAVKKGLLKGKGDHRYGATVLLDSLSRPATTDMEGHFMFSQIAVDGVSNYCIHGSARGVTLETLRTHGKMEAILAAARDWRDVGPRLTAEQRKRIRATAYPKYPLQQAGNHPAADGVHVVESAGDGWRIVPTKVLTRQRGDVSWRYGQEHGVVVPKQYVRPGDTLRLTNPYGPQPCGFRIRVLAAFDPEGKGNIPLLPDKAQISNPTDMTIERDGATLTLSASNRRGEPIWEAERLASWRNRVDMTAHRGIGMWVTGDGSGAILLLRTHARDYIVPIDFKGRRYMEIPNGEAAWADGRWGWHRGSWKSARYESVSGFKIGFGLLPASKDAAVTVEGMRALKELPAELVDPVIVVGNGRLAVKGTIETGQYLAYEGGDDAGVFDANWRPVKRLAVAATDYGMPTGASDVSVESGEAPAPWLEVQFITRGKPMAVSERH
ncbi:hypothetical protein HQ560_15715, partial [bacterium]|nr:hypothetical protein [bacterium]